MRKVLKFWHRLEKDAYRVGIKKADGSYHLVRAEPYFPATQYMQLLLDGVMKESDTTSVAVYRNGTLFNLYVRRAK